MKTEEEPTREELIGLLSGMMRIRRFEDKAAELYTQSLIRGFLHLYNGEEAVAAGVITCLGQEDVILATYREHGHALMRGVPAREIMAEMYGNREGCCRGRGGSMHLFDVLRGFYGGNAIVAGHLPLAAGMALAARKLGSPSITVCFFGEGAMAEGEFHEAMNLAALWQVPLLFVCENNRYAMGTALQATHANTDLAARGRSYGIESETTDGMDVLRVRTAARLALARIRETGKPYFLVCDTYRFRAHSMFDAELYREKSEVGKWKKLDPIPRLEAVLRSRFGFSDSERMELEAALDKEIAEAVAFAGSGKPEQVENLEDYVFSSP